MGIKMVMKRKLESVVHGLMIKATTCIHLMHSFDHIPVSIPVSYFLIAIKNEISVSVFSHIREDAAFANIPAGSVARK